MQTFYVKRPKRHHGLTVGFMDPEDPSGGIMVRLDRNPLPADKVGRVAPSGDEPWARFDADANLIEHQHPLSWKKPLTEEELAVVTHAARQFREATRTGLRVARKKWGIGPSDPIYVRFGTLPDNGVSRNHATGEREAGVSAYRAALDPETAKIRVSLPAQWGTLLTLAQRTPYLIRGKPAGTGAGSDGEPVLSDVEVIAPLDRSEWGLGSARR